MNKIIERFQIDVAIYKSSSPEAPKRKGCCKNMTTFHETVYSVIFGWEWNLGKILRHNILQKFQTQRVDALCSRIP